MNRRARSTAFLAALVALVGCATTGGEFVWVDNYKPAVAVSEKEYLITPGDVLNIRVYNQDAISSRTRVRGDGKISLPFLNDVQAAGLTPSALSHQLQSRLKDFIVNPMVTVALEEARPFEVFVVGEVARPGRYNLEPTSSVLQAIAAAGGLSVFASRDRVFVVRQEATPIRIRFKYDALVRLEGNAGSFRLRHGDTVVIE